MTAHRPSPPAPPDDAADEALPDLDAALTPDAEAQSLVERPDGFYWIGPDGKQEFGPFLTAADALADMNAAGDTDLEPGETLEEAERELGIADWIDPDTGAPAEGTRTRIEDH